MILSSVGLSSKQSILKIPEGSRSLGQLYTARMGWPLFGDQPKNTIFYFLLYGRCKSIHGSLKVGGGSGEISDIGDFIVDIIQVEVDESGNLRFLFENAGIRVEEERS